VTRYGRTVFISFLIFLPAGIVGVIWFQLAQASLVRVVAGEITILVTALAINQAVLVIPLRRRFAAAVERQDADAVDAILDDAAAMWPRNVKMRAFIDGNRAVALMFRERWDEAVAQTRSALTGSGGRTHEGLLLNNLAWAPAHTGALDEAATIGEQALAGASGLFDRVHKWRRRLADLQVPGVTLQKGRTATMSSIPEPWDNVERRVAALKGKGDALAAMSELERFLATAPATSEVRFALALRAVVREDLGDYPGALEDALQAHRLTEPGTYGRYALELSLSSLAAIVGDPQQGAAWLHKALETARTGSQISGATALRKFLEWRGEPSLDSTEQTLCIDVIRQSWRVLGQLGDPDVGNLMAAAILLARLESEPKST